MIRSAVIVVVAVLSNVAQPAPKPDEHAAARLLRDQTDKVFAKWDSTMTPGCASVSKQFTAVAILLLAQDGKLSLDDDVHKYIQELPDFGAPITIRHLIHHTSGLRDQWALLGLAGWRYSLDLITEKS